MNREECEKAMQTINDFFFDEAGGIFISSLDVIKAIELISELITEHFDNPSISFDDIVNSYLARPIWDETLQEWCIVDNFNLQFKTINLTYADQSVKRNFEDGRYYRREVM